MIHLISGVRLGLWLLVGVVLGSGCGPSAAECVARRVHAGVLSPSCPPGLEVPHPSEPLLDRQRFAPEVRHRLESVIRSFGRPDLPRDQRPVALFVLEHAAWADDPGVVLFQSMTARLAFQFGPDFWSAIPEALLRDELSEAVEILSADPPESSPPERAPSDSNSGANAITRPGPVSIPAPGLDPEERHALAHETFSGGMWRLHERLRRRDGPARACAWRAELLAGLLDGDLIALAEEAFAAPVQFDWGGRSGRAPASSSGPRAEIRHLISTLQRFGFDVWLISGLNQRGVEVAGAHVGLPADRCIGTRNQRDAAGRQTAELAPPATCEGKRAAVKQYVGRAPLIVVAGAAEDLTLLETARELPLAVDSGDAALLKIARDRGWMVHHPPPSREPLGPVRSNLEDE